MRRLIGLGFRCDVAFQLRMHGQENVAHFFDWLATPIEGVIKIIEQDFDVFQPEDLVLRLQDNPNSVEDLATGTVFHHQFPLYNGHVQPDFLLFYDAFIKKFQYLADRFRTYLRTKPVTLVRQHVTCEQALRLEEAVLSRFPDADVQFLYVINTGEEFETPHGYARFLKNDWSSLGDPAAWAELLVAEGLVREPYRHATTEILGNAHDDHNLSTSGRFTEAQLLAATQANQRSPAFPLELSRWYAVKGMSEKAEEMALIALARRPGNPDAIFQATLMQQKTGRLDAAEAAVAYLSIAGQPKAPVEWLLEAGKALLHLGRAEEACQYFKNGLQADPFNRELYFHKCRALLAKHDYSHAERAILAAMRRGNFPNIYMHLQANALEGQGRTEEAIVAETKAVELGVGFQSHYHLGLLLHKVGRHEEALQQLQFALPGAGAHESVVRRTIDMVTRAIPGLVA